MKNHQIWGISSLIITFITLPETNIAPENGGFHQESPFQGVFLSGAMSVSGRVFFLNHQTCKSKTITTRPSMDGFQIQNLLFFA